MTQTTQLSLRIASGLEQEIEMIAKQEALRKTDVVRKYLIEGVRRWKLDQAVARYLRDQISLERAALEAGLSLYDMMDELRRRGIALDQTTPNEAREEIRALLAEIAASE
ncbi:MAG: hypothetical protein AUK03_08200 [Anaerolineae bacterium CG2_30_64_16]|nr:MAG: hypothetical protein AUK03_08200 [Anaerolineae bacterium CG2_30_64_16]